MSFSLDKFTAFPSSMVALLSTSVKILSTKLEKLSAVALLSCLLADYQLVLVQLVKQYWFYLNVMPFVDNRLLNYRVDICSWCFFKTPCYAFYTV